MSIGYACIGLGVPESKIKTCRLKNVTDEKLAELIKYNLDSLENMVRYNAMHNIRLFRMSSDIIPFATHPVNALNWRLVFENELNRIGQLLEENNIRVSMHPGQYTVLNAKNSEVVERAIEDLNYHSTFIDAVGGDASNKIVLHVGGVYDNKEMAIQRFIENFSYLDSSVKKRIVIENDERNYNVVDVLRIAETLDIPVVFDNLHHAIHMPQQQKTQHEWIDLCGQTWGECDGNQKIHYSQQNIDKKPGAHSTTIAIESFMTFYEKLKDNNIDIMLEVKDKNLSAIKCQLCTDKTATITELEQEWSRYKYSVLGKSPNGYQTIRSLLKNKIQYPAIEFYHLVEIAMAEKENTVREINAAEHVWGYFKTKATEQEKARVKRLMSSYQSGKTALTALKNALWKLTKKYGEGYLLNSYYFIL